LIRIVGVAARSVAQPDGRRGEERDRELLARVGRAARGFEQKQEVVDLRAAFGRVRLRVGGCQFGWEHC
jgi:hypothetical protein